MKDVVCYDKYNCKILEKIRSTGSTKKLKASICHDEYICHSLGEARQNVLNEIKMLLDKADDRPCLVENTKREVPPLMMYPGYVDTRHPTLLPPESKKVAPFSTLSCHRECLKEDFCVEGAGFIEPKTVDYSYKRRADYDHLTQNVVENACKMYGTDGDGSRFRARNKSIELRGGVLYNCCGCMKKNGLQDQCPRKDCMEAPPECISYNPGPCCGPAQARRKYEAF